MRDKPLIWLGSSRRDLRAFPALARRLAGFQLRRVQQGLDPDDWKPTQTIGPGVREIRIHIAGAHRVFYVATRAEAIWGGPLPLSDWRSTLAHVIDFGHAHGWTSDERRSRHES